MVPKAGSYGTPGSLPGHVPRLPGPGRLHRRQPRRDRDRLPGDRRPARGLHKRAARVRHVDNVAARPPAPSSPAAERSPFPLPRDGVCEESDQKREDPSRRRLAKQKVGERRAGPYSNSLPMKHIAAARRPLLQVLALAVALVGPGCGGDGGAAAPTFNFAWDMVGIVGTGQSLSVGALGTPIIATHAAVQQPEAVVRRGDRRASVRSHARVAGAGAADRAAPPDRHQLPERLPRQPLRRDAARRDGEPAHRDGDGAGDARLRERSHRRRRVRPADDRHQEEPHEPPRGRDVRPRLRRDAVRGGGDQPARGAMARPTASAPSSSRTASPTPATPTTRTICSSS